MKILVVGAGAIGGFLAARMLEAGLDVTLLVREARKRQLLETGLVVVSPAGDYEGRPAMLVSGESAEPFDLVIAACKSYALDAVLKDIKPYLHEETVLLPFLNGMRHMTKMAEMYPKQPLLGGVARAESTLDEQGRIIHLTPFNRFTYGNYGQINEQLYNKIKSIFSKVPALVEKENIKQDLWEKYSYISALAGLTTLFRGTVGDIRDTPDGLHWFRRAFTETTEVIRSAGGQLADDLVDRYMSGIPAMSPDSTSSMHRDLQKGLPTEHDMHGYLVELAHDHGVQAPLLEVIFQNLVIYENKRK